MKCAFLAVTAILVASSAFAGPAGEPLTEPPSLSKHGPDWDEQPAPSDVKYEIVEKEVPAEDPEDREFEYSIKLEGSEPVFLARRQVCSMSERTEEFGFNSKSLRLAWLQPRKLLRVWWHTLSSGSGHYLVGTNLLLVSSSDGWETLLRDSQDLYCRGGADYSAGKDYAFVYKSEGAVLRITETAWQEDLAYKEVPLGRMIEGTCFRAVAVITEWDFRLEGDRLVYLHGVRKVEPGIADWTPKEIGQYLADQEDPEQVAQKIRQLNPSLNPAEGLPKIVEIDRDVKAHVPDERHYYFGGE